MGGWINIHRDGYFGQDPESQQSAIWQFSRVVRGMYLQENSSGLLLVRRFHGSFAPGAGFWGESRPKR